MRNYEFGQPKTNGNTKRKTLIPSLTQQRRKHKRLPHLQRQTRHTQHRGKGNPRKMRCENMKARKTLLETRLRNLKRKQAKLRQHPKLMEEAIELKADIDGIERELQNLQ